METSTIPPLTFDVALSALKFFHWIETGLSFGITREIWPGETYNHRSENHFWETFRRNQGRGATFFYTLDDTDRNRLFQYYYRHRVLDPEKRATEKNKISDVTTTQAIN
jgi:hypothetical protein